MHRSQWRGTLRDYVSPVLGKLAVQTIDTEQVLKVLELIWSTITENRACAVGSRSCSTAPAATKGIRRDGTDTSSTGSQSATRAQREALAAMPYDEVTAFMGALRASYGRQIARAFDSGLEHLTERLNR